MMRNRANTPPQTTAPAKKKHYRKPNLRVLGRLGELTQGGAGSKQETGALQNPNRFP